MKYFLIIFFLLFTICLADEATSSNEVMLQSIIRSTNPGMYVGGRIPRGVYALPTPKGDDTKNYFAASNSQVDLQRYMLDETTPEAIRIAYAISIIRGRIREKKDLEEDSKLMQLQLALGARLRELEEAEQGAAANP